MSKVFGKFAGSYVSVAVKGMKGSSKGKIANLLLMGYLLDEDEDYFYIGESQQEVSVAVLRSDVVAIMSAADMDETEMDTEGEMQ